MHFELRCHMGISEIGDSSEDDGQVPFRPSKLSDFDVPEVVGLDFEKDHIIQHLLDRSISRRTVLSIVGIGGLGKTTLGQKVYESYMCLH
jgi:ABC-type multidrug transport system fused ATPase/permease subunit